MIVVACIGVQWAGPDSNFLSCVWSLLLITTECSNPDLPQGAFVLNRYFFRSFFLSSFSLLLLLAHTFPGRSESACQISLLHSLFFLLFTSQFQCCVVYLVFFAHHRQTFLIASLSSFLTKYLNHIQDSLSPNPNMTAATVSTRGCKIPYHQRVSSFPQLVTMARAEKEETTKWLTQ